jgi:hypothetical protein
MSINKENESGNEMEEFFNSLNAKNEEKYINFIKNSSAKYLNYINEN